MAPSPFRRRRKATRLARNLALAEAALALAKDRAAATGGAVRRRVVVLAAGGAAVAAGSFVLLKRVRSGRSGGDAVPSAPPPPQPSNYDVSGPVANTATPVPAPDPSPPVPEPGAGTATPGVPPTRPAIDERAEEEAAAAEAANIGGGSQSEYAGITGDMPADEAERPVVEAGGGESEGQEQTEAELAQNAVVRDQAPSDAERQIEDAIEAQDEPGRGETPEPLEPGSDRATDAEEGLIRPPGSEGGGISGRPGARLDDAAETPGVPPTGSPATEPESGGRTDGDAQTWSGRGS
jgi:hypothetical protein